MTKIGVISDTHGLVRPEALDALKGSDLILHAGDIGSPDVLAQLGSIAKVTAIRGNNDTDAWAELLPETIRLTVEDTSIYMVHSVKELAIDPTASSVHVVVSGHSHRASIDTPEGVLFLNPGSAGPRRFSLPLTVASLTISGKAARARIIELNVAAATKSRSRKPTMR